MDILINIVAGIVIIATGIAISWGFYGLFSAVAYGLIQTTKLIQKESKEGFSTLASYLGMFLAFLLGIRVIFWWLIPKWQCYWGSSGGVMCLS